MWCVFPRDGRRRPAARAPLRNHRYFLGQALYPDRQVEGLRQADPEERQGRNLRDGQDRLEVATPRGRTRPRRPPRAEGPYARELSRAQVDVLPRRRQHRGPVFQGRDRHVLLLRRRPSRREVLVVCFTRKTFHASSGFDPESFGRRGWQKNSPRRPPRRGILYWKNSLRCQLYCKHYINKMHGSAEVDFYIRE